MNLKTIFFVILSVSLILNLVLGLSLIGQHIASNDQKKKISNLGSQLKKETEDTDVKQSNRSNQQNVKYVFVDKSEKPIKSFINDFFKIQYEYSNDDYTQRFKKIKTFVTNDVYNQLTGSGIPAAPKTQFSNKVKDLQIYITGKNNKTVNALILLTTIYTIDNKDMDPTKQIFEVSVQPYGEKWKIVKLTLLGNLQPYENS